MLQLLLLAAVATAWVLLHEVFQGLAAVPAADGCNALPDWLRAALAGMCPATRAVTSCPGEHGGQVEAGKTARADLARDGQVVPPDFEARLWCLESCPDADDCRMRECDGKARTCLVTGVEPDRTPCLDGAGYCVNGTCCIPASCQMLGGLCGDVDDGCGGKLSCGPCANPLARCYQGRCCIPRTCADLGRWCGEWNDGCGGTTGPCGTCGPEAMCTSVGQCACRQACGSTCCPDVPGFVVTCNAAGACQYTNPEDRGESRWDVWVFVPPGIYTLGSAGPEGGDDSGTLPVRVVTLARGFLISKYETTVESYEACSRLDPTVCTPPSTADMSGLGWGVNTSDNGRGDHPQNGLTWYQAKAYCTRIGGRLPSQVEWEAAAAGPTHRKYPWGDEPEPDCAHAVFGTSENESRPWGCNSCTANGCSGTMPVGSAPAGASWVGAMDMAGNVQEWCEDTWHASFEGVPTDGSAWVTPGLEDRIAVGGSFDFTADGLRVSAVPERSPALERAANRGVRCVRDLPGVGPRSGRRPLP